MYGKSLPILFGLQFALPVCRVGFGCVVLSNLGVGLLFAHGSKHAERADEHEALQRHVQGYEGVGQVACAIGVDAEEVVAVQALSGSRGVHHILKLVLLQLLFQPFRV